MKPLPDYDPTQDLDGGKDSPSYDAVKLPAHWASYVLGAIGVIVFLIGISFIMGCLFP